MNADLDMEAVVTTEFFRTSQSWDGAPLPDYLSQPGLPLAVQHPDEPPAR